jgi:hypothetical protein
LAWLVCNSTLKEGLIYATAKNITEEKKLRELNREEEVLQNGSWEIDLVNESVFWSDEVHQLHDTDVKSFIPAFRRCHEFYRADFRQLVKTILLHVFRPDNNAILKLF